MSKAAANQEFMDGDIEGEEVLSFLTDFQMLEQALVRAGFIRAGPVPGDARADWARFVRHIELHFDPDSSPELQGAVGYLLADPDKMELRRERLLGSLPGEMSSASSDMLWLAELVQETGNKLIHAIHFVKEPDCDLGHITSARMVIEAWSHCDPAVESLLAPLQ